MHIQLLKSKIHRASVTASSLDYEGSLTIDRELMQKAGILPYEKVLVSNLYNGNRFETYAIPGEPGAREICLNGATAHLGTIGDRLTIMAFGTFPAEEGLNWKPRVLVLGDENRIISERGI